ncbi:MAG: serine--tRNA ligase, partial [Prochlorococcus sp.]
MLDQRLVRENPDLITSELGRRGMTVDLTGLQLIAQQQRNLEEQRSKLQAEGNRIGKEVGQLIKNGSDPKASEVAEMRQQGNIIKQKVAVLEDEEKQLSARLREQLLTLPNLPSPDCPEGRDESDNQERRRWGTPREGEDLLEHWEIGEQLSLFETERSVRIAQSRFITLTGQGARLERALINFMLDLHSAKGYKEIMPPVLVNSA